MKTEQTIKSLEDAKSKTQDESLKKEIQSKIEVLKNNKDVLK